MHIWVSKEKMVLDILAKKGAICSDRPAAFPNVPGTKDWKYLPLQGFHDTWRRQRKFTHFIFGTAHEKNYYGHHTIEVPRTLIGLLQNPQLWSSQLEQYQARFLSRCAFGTPRHASALCTNAWRLLINISPAGRLSNVLPGSMKVPKCLAWWRVDEQDRQDKENALYKNCQEEVREQWEKGNAPPSFTRTYLEHGDHYGFPTDIEAAFNVGMVSMAGIHTTSSPLHTFFLAMTLYPEWMVRLQKDIDAVCGDRLPLLSDMPDLPMMRAIVKECLRWRPAVPTGMSFFYLFIGQLADVVKAFLMSSRRIASMTDISSPKVHGCILWNGPCHAIQKFTQTQKNSTPTDGSRQHTPPTRSLSLNSRPFTDTINSDLAAESVRVSTSCRHRPSAFWGLLLGDLTSRERRMKRVLRYPFRRMITTPF